MGDALQGIADVGRITAYIAHIRAGGGFKRAHAADRMLGTDHGRGIAQLAWPMPGAGAVGGAAVPRHANQTDLDLFKARMIGFNEGQAHKGGRILTLKNKLGL